MKVTKIEEFQSDIEKVWSVVTNNNDFSWRSDIKDLIIIDDVNFIEINHKDYEVNFKITDCIPNEFYAFEMYSKNTYGNWTGNFSKSKSGGTIVEFTEDVSTNNIIMKLFLRKFLKKHQTNYIFDLKKAVGE